MAFIGDACFTTQLVAGVTGYKSADVSLTICDVELNGSGPPSVYRVQFLLKSAASDEPSHVDVAMIRHALGGALNNK